jgi:hypothetical protein
MEQKQVKPLKEAGFSNIEYLQPEEKAVIFIADK